jgi:hypothetical protein
MQRGSFVGTGSEAFWKGLASPQSLPSHSRYFRHVSFLVPLDFYDPLGSKFSVRNLESEIWSR